MASGCATTAAPTRTTCTRRVHSAPVRFGTEEFRNVNINGAVGQLYQEMAGRHRADPGSIQIIHATTVPDEKCRRDHVLEGKW